MTEKKYKQITEPDNKGFQVRIVRNKKEYSRYFSHKLWGGRQQALKSAINWRDQTLVLFSSKPTYQQMTRIFPNKISTGVTGVSRTIQYDKRRDVRSLIYSCHWRLNGKGHTKTFHVGRMEEINADQELHAFRTAIRFRHEYEMYRANGLESQFDPTKYKNWKKERLYDSSGLQSPFVK